MYKYLYINI